VSESTIDAIVAALTLAEKASLCDGGNFWSTRAIPRLGLPSVTMADGPHGLRKQAESFGFPGSLPATCFPPAVAIASSWSVATAAAVGRAIAHEAAVAGVDIVLGPGVNIKRSPMCGRNFEYFSEDPVVAGNLGAAMVAAMQERGIGASVKHFAVNNQETSRMQISAEVSERAMREIYLPAFERVVTQAKPSTVMCSYNRINGVYASENDWLLTTVLRDEWGFDGVVISDWGAVHHRVAGVRAGLDLEMPGVGTINAEHIVAAVTSGQLAIADLDRTVRRMVSLAMSSPAVAREIAPAVPSEPSSIDLDAQHEIAHGAALDCAVLLKNTGDVLPLSPSSGGPIAVIGTFAAAPRFQGVGSSQVNPTQVDDALCAIRSIVDGRREVIYAAGYGDGDAAVLLAKAVTAAAKAEDVVVFLGLPDADEAESYDRSHLNLPAEQLVLLRSVLAANPRVAVVLSNGSPVEMSSWDGDVPAILEGWLLGQAGGLATAELLLGLANPSGKLAETVPVRLQDTSSFLSFPGDGRTVTYADDVFVGYRWFDARELDVAYPFGHGLSYTTFEYSGLSVEVVDDGTEPVVDVTCTITNTGNRAGAEVVQVYVGDVASSVQRPVRELKAFSKVAIEPGASTTVSVRLTARDFAFFHPVLRRWVVEGGTFDIIVGASSRDLRLVGSVELSGEPVVYPINETSSMAEWLAHPVVGTELSTLLLGDAGYLTPPPMWEAFRTASIINVAQYPESPFSERDIAQWVERANQTTEVLA